MARARADRGTALAAEAPLVAYADAHTSRPPRWLDAVDRRTRTLGHAAIMLSGNTVGRLLTMLTAAVRPRLAVDVGTFTGYSALCIAEGLPPGGRVVTCEVDPAVAAIARGHFARSPHRAKIDLRVGPAIETLRRVRGRIDLAFIDADKGGYWAYYDAIVGRLAPDGVIVVDNTLLFGTVALSDRDARALRPELQKHRAAIRAFNRRVLADPRTEQCVLTVRDGVTLIQLRRGRGPGSRSRRDARSGGARRGGSPGSRRPRSSPRPRAR
jgi:caffeoyl-CoA O-methyltransferase